MSEVTDRPNPRTTTAITTDVPVDQEIRIPRSTFDEATFELIGCAYDFPERLSRHRRDDVIALRVHYRDYDVWDEDEGRDYLWLHQFDVLSLLGVYQEFIGQRTGEMRDRIVRAFRLLGVDFDLKLHRHEQLALPTLFDIPKPLTPPTRFVGSEVR